jgi:hypothetical protein
MSEQFWSRDVAEQRFRPLEESSMATIRNDPIANTASDWNSADDANSATIVDAAAGADRSAYAANETDGWSATTT